MTVHPFGIPTIIPTVVGTGAVAAPVFQPVGDCSYVITLGKAWTPAIAPGLSGQLQRMELWVYLNGFGITFPSSILSGATISAASNTLVYLQITSIDGRTVLTNSRTVPVGAAVTAPALKTMFVGGDVGFPNMTTADVAQFLATGKGGIYTHGDQLGQNGYQAAQKIWAAFKAYGSGVLELGTLSTFFDPGINYDQFCKPVGWVPQYINATFATPPNYVIAAFKAADLANIKAWANKIRSRSELANISIAGFVTPGGNDDAADPLQGEGGHTWNENDSIYGPFCQACLYTGGIAHDIPSTNLVNLGNGWPQFVASQIKWGASKSIRNSVVFSPGGSTTFMEDTRGAVAKLVAAGAIPNDWSIENYQEGTENNATGNATISSNENTPESINAVALWVAQNAPTVARTS